MIIETNSLYKLTRPARAVKDREFLGATAITELERLIRLDYLGLTPDDILDDKKAINKSRGLRPDAWERVQEAYGYDLDMNEASFVDCKELFSAKPHAIDVENKTIHMVTLPYTALNMVLTESEAKDDKGFNDRLWTALGNILVLQENGIDIGRCLVHYVYINTPDTLLSSYDNRLIHQIDESLFDIITVEVVLKDEDKNTIIETRDKILKYYPFIQE